MGKQKEMYAVRLLVLVFALALAACSISSLRSPPRLNNARALEVGGVWILTVESPMGTDEMQALFLQSGDRLTGTLTSSNGEMPLEGRVQGNAVSFGMSLLVRGQRLQLDYAGVVEDDLMSGTVQFGPIGSGKFSGVRRAEVPAP